MSIEEQLDLQRMLDESRTENERLRQQNIEMAEELNALRNVVFSRMTGKENKIDKTDAIAFPYTVQHRVVVFGGHDTWSKAIRSMLKNVRFVERNAQPNRDMIKKADVVWIQVNALGHKHYHNIMDAARAHGVPVRYFAYASAEKCARQVVEEDMSIL
ncbi:MAG: hypothetical protein PHY12_00115 [Eubacteriales bacterium]|nr:hypothetical protein [Eubacteriales bacterium]